MRIHRLSGRLVASVGAAAISLALTAGVTHGAHTLGTLDCGDAGVYQVEGVKPAGPPFDVPPPWSGIYLLEGTTKVFRVFANSHFGTRMTPPIRHPWPSSRALSHLKGRCSKSHGPSKACSYRSANADRSSPKRAVRRTAQKAASNRPGGMMTTACS